MKQISIVNAVSKLALIGVTGLLVACGSSGSSTPADASISGTIVAAPVNGADVSVVDGTGNEVVAAVKTDANGKYSLVIPNGSLGQNLIIKSTGGTFTDEATGNQDVAAGEMLAYLSANSITNGSSVSATPGSTIIAKLVMDHGMTMTEAHDAFDSAFGYTTDLSVEPADATAPAADATDASKLAGLRAAAFSQLTMDLGLLSVEQFDLLTALAEDLADGELDGELNGVDVAITASVMIPIDIQNRFVTALLNFHNDGLMGDTHGNDLTGLKNNQIGLLPFSKVAMTGLTSGAYKVVYEPGMMDAMQGKTMFKLHISDDSGAPVSSTVSLMLMMFMEAHKHSTPDLDCAESGTAGTYDCTVYYVMASGEEMGFWQMMVMVDMKSAVLYPPVMMAMGDTTRALLKGDITDDTISMMGVTSSRPYNLFRESLTGTTGAHTFEVFIAPMEDMMSFPALEVGLDLNSGALIVNTVTVVMTTDPAGIWTPATPGTSPGMWKATLNGLTDGTEGKVYVELLVNGKQKTTNGLTDTDSTNDYAFFNVTP